jgi:hypothetical protein
MRTLSNIDADPKVTDTLEDEIKGLLRQVGNWRNALDRVLREQPFFSPESDITSQSSSVYKGLGTSRTPPQGGKRQELRDKMDSIWGLLRNAVDNFNRQRSAAFSWDVCSSDSVAQTPVLTIAPANCYTPECIDALIAAINQEKNTITQAKVRLISARDTCNNSGCSTSCNDIFAQAISDREREERDLAAEEEGGIMFYLRKLQLLAQSWQKVNELITRVEEAEDSLQDFSDAGEEFCTYLDDKDNIEYWKELDYPRGQGQATYTWQTKSPTMGGITHEVRVTVSDFKLPHIGTYMCAVIFGRGARLKSFQGEVSVSVERYDSKTGMNLGFLPKWIFPRTVRSSSTAQYSPRISREADGVQKIKLLRTE